MEEFIQEFKAEASSIIQRLQEQVLLLEHEKDNKSIIEEIFRGVHTLKGSSRMFGFEKIERITHDLETTYDQIREGVAKPTKAVVELSLAVIDMCAAILNDSYDQAEYNSILEKLGSEEVLQSDEEQSAGVYQVLYHPKENIYERGVNPMAAIQELKDIGTHRLFILKQTSSLEEQEKAKKFESAFEVILPIKGSREIVEDVFLFMDPEEFSIHLLETDRRSWQDAMDRAQKIAGRKFTVIETEERQTAFSLYFENTAEVKVVEQLQPNELKTSSKTNDSGINFINVKLERLDEIMKLVSELVTIKAELNYQSTVLADMKLTSLVERLERVTTRFRDNAFTMRLVPLQILSLKFQRMARDLGEKLAKDINVLTEGLDTEIDKTIINEIEAPLMHILRNAIDHGLETTDERIQLGKNPRGLLKIVAFYAGANVFIQVQDDGRGLNLKRIRQKAIDRGIISETEKLSDNEIINLIFEPGFSTHDKATEYSGRGVGMDVVKQKLKELRGSIEITTEEGLGTAFTLRLPLSLSILDVLHVKVNGINYLLPHNEIERCLSERLNNDIIQRRGHNIKYKGELIPHLSLGEIFLEKSTTSQEPCVIVINKNDQYISLEVDEIVSKEQLVIKPVDEALRSLEYLSGVAVLGNGELAFLLNPLKLKESYANGNLTLNA